MKRVIQLVAIILVGFGAACAPRLDVALAERAALSRCRTWDWRPFTASTVDADPRAGAALHFRLSRLIERALRTRGFARVADGADFFVTYHLEQRLRVEDTVVPLAPYLLSSHHSSPSYWIEGPKRERRTYREVRLEIDISEAGGRTLWRAALRKRVEGRSAISLEDAVATLFEPFPSSGFGVE